MGLKALSWVVSLELELKMEILMPVFLLKEYSKEKPVRKGEKQDRAEEASRGVVWGGVIV